MCLLVQVLTFIDTFFRRLVRKELKLNQTITYSPCRSRTGRKGPYAAYYVQIQPGGGSFVGCGLWHPDAQPVALLRRDFDRKSHKLKKVLLNEAVRKELFNGVPEDEKKVIKAFVELNKENMLKTKPKVSSNLPLHDGMTKILIRDTTLRILTSLFLDYGIIQLVEN